MTLIPLNGEETAGRFRIWLSIPDKAEPMLMWDRKIEGGFPELKILVSCSYLVYVNVCNNNRSPEATHS